MLHPTLRFFGPSWDLARDRRAKMIGIIPEQFQILGIIVRRIIILVMDYLGLRQVSTEDLLHHKSMFTDSTLLGRMRMIRGIDQDVSITIEMASTLP